MHNMFERNNSGAVDDTEPIIKVTDDNYKPAPEIGDGEEEDQSNDKRQESRYVHRRQQRSKVPRTRRVQFQNRSDPTCDDMMVKISKNHLYEIYQPRSITKMGYALAIRGSGGR